MNDSNKPVEKYGWIFNNGLYKLYAIFLSTKLTAYYYLHKFFLKI